MPPTRFEPAIQGRERLKTYIRNRRAAGIGECKLHDLIFYRGARGGAVGSGYKPEGRGFDS